MKSVFHIIGLVTCVAGCSVMGSSGAEGSQGSGEWEHPDYDSTLIVSNVSELLDAVEYANANGNVEILLGDEDYSL